MSERQRERDPDCTRRRGENRPVGDSRRVVWIEGACPADGDSAIVLEALRAGLETVEQVAAHLANVRYRHDLQRGGWATDIALVAPLYHIEAMETLTRLDGRVIRITEG